ncbi:hypothetical protein QQS21_006615 [Conoideocrella luteorostrata]|uniref:Acetylserotonin methytransferase-like protein n=1 Tax=Conoideocrella luteorostrata TaxID=1105319 RepID=A0AAJ0CMD5_9HYPO|nr:hypothetical protein QQS21_006615 [Conoideocrella luteorostrata]
MPSPQTTQQGNFSLFPSPNSSRAPRNALHGQQRGRRSESQERRPSIQELRVDTSVHAQIGQNGRQTPPPPPPPLQQQEPPRRGATPSNWPLSNEASSPSHHHYQDRRQYAEESMQAGQAPVQQSRQSNEVPGRTGTAFSDDHTLVRSNSGRSRASIAKQPLSDGPSASGSGSGALRSIFPTYNPQVPLGQQEYAPTQLSPTHIPRAVISRQSVYEEEPESPIRESQPGHSSPPPTSSPPRQATRGLWPLRIHTQPPPVIPTPCSTADLKSLWRVANGWKASSSEGRVFCLKLSQQKDAPVYTLTSGSAHPFWNLRLDPTSASAYVSLTRHDPSKPYKAPKPNTSPPSPSDATSGRSSGTGSRASDTKHWYEALSTTLEEESRKHPPNDGLVALLMPTAAMRMATEKANDPASVNAAENECARLVWDEDTATHYLVHNALAKPFCVTVERNPAYSRIEYTLEHNESPKHIAKLTRDGTGGGWIELDTTVASQIDSCYILDVAVTALILVAAAEDRNSPAPLETFEPPPAAFLGAANRCDSGSGRLSKLSIRREGNDKDKDGKKRRKMEEFEIDVESQLDSLGKDRRESKSAEDKLPFLLRVVVKLAKGLFALVIWILTVLFKCVEGVFKVLYKCVGSKY